jgi:hypothetical protein
VTQPERQISKRIQELVVSQLEGHPAADDQRELTNLLRDNPWAQQLYIEFIQDSASLRWWSANDPASEFGGEVMPAESARNLEGPSKRLPILPLATLAATVLIALSLAIISAYRGPQVAGGPQPEGGANEKAVMEQDARPSLPTQQSDSVAGVATLTRLRDVKWAEETKAASEMSRLIIGQILHVDEGEAEVEFDQAVKMVIRGPAQVEIRSATEVFSPFGTLSARVGKTGIGFVIETPAGRITDLGTEFGVAIHEQGDTDVAVFRGAVDLTYGPRDSKLEPSMSRRLVQGQGLRLDSDGHWERLVSINDSRFPNVNQGASTTGAPRSSIITDIRDNVRDGVDSKFYRIVPGGLREDAPAYVDREHQWNGIDAAGIPPILLGSDYVMPFNGDKLLPKLNVKVRIGQPAVLFVFLSDVARVPDWLTKDFEKTDMRIGLDESSEFSNPAYRLAIGPGEGINTRFSIWKREITKPTTVTLGSIEQGKRAWGFCMYGIAAVPLEAARDAAAPALKAPAGSPSSGK